MSTDKQWEKFGKEDPYFGVITHEKYSRKNLTKKAKQEFFKSGKEHVEDVLKTIKEKVDKSFNPKEALDFGCGVGRIVLPLSSYVKSVDGVDISLSMLKEAKKNAKEQDIKNVNFIQTNTFLNDSKTYDFIHSFIVFQHIPTKKGYVLFSELLDKLNPKGVAVIQTIYDATALNKWFQRIKKVPLMPYVINVLRKRKWNSPHLEMNRYELKKLFFIAQKHNVQETFIEFTNHGGYFGVTLYLKKN